MYKTDNDHEYDELNEVLTQLTQLAPQGHDGKTNPHQALRQLKQGAHTRSPFLNPPTWPVGRYALMAGLALFLIAIIALPSGRAMASNFLGLFRVQKFAPISISPQQIERLAALGESGLYPGEVISTDEPGEAVKFDSFAEARTYLTQLDTPTLPSTFKGLGEPDAIRLEDSESLEIKLNLAGARAILEETGGDPATLPDSLDGQTIQVEVNEILTQQWYAADVAYIQMVSPDIGYPAGVEPEVIGEAILQFLGMDAIKAYRVARNIDWVTTMVLPIPAEFGSFSEVRLGETTGLAIETTGGTVILVWQENDRVNQLMAYGENSSVEYLINLVEERGSR